MRLLTELRVTEFARLIEETDLSATRAAKDVGWNDPRVASHWFRRRYGLTPTQYRRTPQAHVEDPPTLSRVDDLHAQSRESR